MRLITRAAGFLTLRQIAGDEFISGQTKIKSVHHRFSPLSGSLGRAGANDFTITRATVHTNHERLPAVLPGWARAVLQTPTRSVAVLEALVPANAA